MRATINGITIEGTPQEIAEYQRLKAAEAREKPFREIGRDIGRTLGELMIMSQEIGAMRRIINQEKLRQSVAKNHPSVQKIGVSNSDVSKMIN